jgi:PAS domain S-box-containing protein
MANDPSDATRLELTLAKTTAAALAVSRIEGGDVFAQLACRLAEILGVDATMIARFDPAVAGRVVTLATCLDGRMLRSFDYDLAGTPCREMVDRESRFVASGVRDEFTPGTLFHAEKFDSYAAHITVDAAGRRTGLIVAMHRRPMTHRALTEALLQIFAVRAGAELERQRVDAAAREAEASYRAIFEAAEDAVFVHDLETGRVVDVNPQACRMYGYTRDELLKVRIGDVSSNVPPYTEAEAIAHLNAARGGEPVRFEWHRRSRDGSLHWDEVVLKRATIRGAERILAFTREITERKAALEALRLREEQYRAIFEGSADALVLWSRDVRIVDVNAAFTSIYGYTRDEIIGSTFGDRLPTLDVARRIRMMHRALEGHTGHLETRTIRKNGEAFDVEIRYLPILHRGEPHVLAIARDITERRRAEEALRTSEEQYRAIFNASADALVLWDSQLNIVDVNPAFERIYGMTRDLVVTRGYPTSMPPEYVEQRLQLVRRAIEGETQELITRAHRGDGSSFEVELRVIPIRHRGEPHALAMARDITERKRAEERLRASEERYRLLFEMESAAIVLVDAETLKLVDANLAAAQVYGYSREELLGMTAVDLSAEPQETAPSIRDSHGALNIPLRWHRRKNGEVFPVEITANRLALNGREIVLASIREITERKRAEQALRDSEAQYRAIFNASADALVLRDADFRIVDVNATYEAMSGFPREAVLGLDRVIANPPEVAQAIRELHGRALAGEPIVFETTLLRRDGARYNLELRGVPIQHRGAQHVLYMGRDVTDRTHAEQERRELESQLRQAQKMEAIGHLTGGIAHDFNNILTSVMGYLALAAERPAAEADPKLQSHLEQAQQSCHRARDLIQQMLTFSRGRRGEPRPVALRPLLDESARMLRATLPTSLDLVTTVEGDPIALVDPVQAHQVLLNLCINARDSMSEVGRIGVGARRTSMPTTTCSSCRRQFSGDFVELAVTDTGAGIPPGVIDRMFEPFFTTKDIGQGTGMGLAIVHGVVHDHAGHLLVDSTPGTGTTFRILLPLAAPSLDAVATISDERVARRTPLEGRLLLVEDEQAVLGFMRELLEGWGLSVVAARDPADALRWFSLEPDRFDVVLTDHSMPGMTGLDLARQLLAQRPGLPVVMYSGRSDLLNAEAVRAEGIRAMLPKPVDPGALQAALRAVLPAVTPSDASAPGRAPDKAAGHSH